MRRQFHDEAVGERLQAIVFLFRLVAGIRGRSVVDVLLVRRVDPIDLVLSVGFDGRFILGADIAALDTQAAVMADADEDAGHGDFIRLEADGTLLQGFHRRFDLAEPGVDIFRELLGVGVIVLKLIVFGFQCVEVRDLVLAHRLGLADDPAQTVGMAVGKVRADLDPFPALGADRFRMGFELFIDEFRKQASVMEPSAVVGLEEIAKDGAAGHLIGVEPDELRPPVGGAHGAFGQHAADFIGLFRISPFDRLPDLFLALMVGIDREGHELVEGQFLLGIGVEKRWRDSGELEPLLDDVRRDEEGRRDLFLALAFLAHRLEGAELVERMKRRTLNILGETVFFGEAVRAHDAGHGRRAVQTLLLDQQFERPVAASAGRDLEHAGFSAVLIQHRPDGDRGQKRAPGDVFGELVDRDAGLDAADIGLAEHQLVEGDVARGAEGDFLRLGHVSSPWAGWPKASLSTSKPVTENPARLFLLRKRRTGKAERRPQLRRALEELLRLALHFEPGVLLRLRPGDGGDALHEIEYGLRRPTFFGEDCLDDSGRLRLGEAPFAEEVGAVIVAVGDDALARCSNAFDEGSRRGVSEAGQRRRRLVREAIGGVFGMSDANFLEVLNAPEIAVLADGAQIETGDAERLRADFRIPAIEAPEIEIGRSVGQLARLDRVHVVDQEEEDVSVGGVERGRVLGDVDHRIVDAARPVERAGHFPARIASSVPRDLLHGRHEFVVVDAAIIRAGDGAQFRAPVFGFQRLDLLGSVRGEPVLQVDARKRRRELAQIGRRRAD